VKIEYRWADGHYEQLQPLAAELVRQGVSAIVAPTHDAALAARKTATTIPVIFNSGGDPVASGLVASMNRPGANVSGVSMFSNQLEAKRLGLLHVMIPKVTIIGALINPLNAAAEKQRNELKEAAKSLSFDVVMEDASTDSDLEKAFASLLKAGVQAVTAGADPFLASHRERLIALLSEQNKLPAIWEWSDFVEDGGLMSYGTSIVDAYRQVGVYIGRILRGEKPEELPVLQPVKFELAINMRAAKALGIEIPATLLARADQVIE
jgi:ABC-type uncharacterized transport system substrate-binding protein